MNLEREMDLSKLTPAPWKVYLSGGINNHLIGALQNYVARIFCDRSTLFGMSSLGPEAEAAFANAKFIALARNAFDGDPEALAWWEANRNKR